MDVSGLTLTLTSLRNMKLVSSFAHPFYRSSTRLTAVTRKLNFSTQYGLARSLMASSIVLGPHHTRQFDPTLSNIGASLWAAYSSSSGAQAGYSGLDIIKTTDTEPAVFQAESEEVFDMLMDRLEADDVIDRDDLEVRYRVVLQCIELYTKTERARV